jgi:hypothetical protein
MTIPEDTLNLSSSSMCVPYLLGSTKVGAKNRWKKITVKTWRGFSEKALEIPLCNSKNHSRIFLVEASVKERVIFEEQFVQARTLDITWQSLQVCQQILQGGQGSTPGLHARLALVLLYQPQSVSNRSVLVLGFDVSVWETVGKGPGERYLKGTQFFLVHDFLNNRFL